MSVSNRLIAFFVIVITLANIIFYISLYQMTEVQMTEMPMPTALISSVATANLCLNRGPVILQSCNSTAASGSLYTCDIDVNDTDSTSFTFSENTTLFEINSTSGVINLTPDSGDAGMHNINITVDDNSGCLNSQDSSLLNLNISASETELFEDGSSCSSAGECSGGYCCNSICQSTSCSDGGGRAITSKEGEEGEGEEGEGEEGEGEEGEGEEGEGEEGEGEDGEGEAEAEAVEIRVQEFDVSPIKIRLKEKQRTKRELMVSNTAKKAVPVRLNVVGVKDVTIDDKEFILDAGESRRVGFSVEAREPDVYSGSIVIETPERAISIPLIVEVETEEIIFRPVIGVTKEVKQGDFLEFNLGIDSLTREKLTAEVVISVKGTKGNTVYSLIEEMDVDKGISFLGSYKTPKSMEAGDYVLAVAVKSRGTVSVTSEAFSVKKSVAIELPGGLVYYISFKAFVIILIINMLILAATFTIWIMMIRRRK